MLFFNADPFDGTSAKNIEAGVYCSLMPGHAMCDVDTLSIPPPTQPQPSPTDQSVAQLNIQPISRLLLYKATQLS